VQLWDGLTDVCCAACANGSLANGFFIGIGQNVSQLLLDLRCLDLRQTPHDGRSVNSLGPELVQERKNGCVTGGTQRRDDEGWKLLRLIVDHSTQQGDRPLRMVSQNLHGVVMKGWIFQGRIEHGCQSQQPVRSDGTLSRATITNFSASKQLNQMGQRIAGVGFAQSLDRRQAHWRMQLLQVLSQGVDGFRLVALCHRINGSPCDPSIGVVEQHNEHLDRVDVVNDRAKCGRHSVTDVRMSVVGLAIQYGEFLGRSVIQNRRSQPSNAWGLGPKEMLYGAESMRVIHVVETFQQSDGYSFTAFVLEGSAQTRSGLGAERAQGRGSGYGVVVVGAEQRLVQYGNGGLMAGGSQGVHDSDGQWAFFVGLGQRSKGCCRNRRAHAAQGFKQLKLLGEPIVVQGDQHHWNGGWPHDGQRTNGIVCSGRIQLLNERGDLCDGRFVDRGGQRHFFELEFTHAKGLVSSHIGGGDVQANGVGGHGGVNGNSLGFHPVGQRYRHRAPIAFNRDGAWAGKALEFLDGGCASTRDCQRS